MRVRATARGFYGQRLRRIGDVFTLERPEEFSDRWMVPVPPATPESSTSAQRAMKAEHDGRSPIGATERVCIPIDVDADRAVDVDFDPFSN